MSKQQTQTVWVAKLHKRSTQKYYHTREDCRQLQRSDAKKPKQLNMLNDDFVECEICKHGEQKHGVQQKKDCPYCGETVGKLPNHLPCNES